MPVLEIETINKKCYSSILSVNVLYRLLNAICKNTNSSGHLRHKFLIKFPG